MSRPARTKPVSSGRPSRLVAVIDLGTESIRMAIAEVFPGQPPCILESVFQSVGLGKDTFTRGSISQSTTERCVEILRSFRQLMEEYGIRDPDNIHAIATSAVREASNRDAVIDRMYVGAGIEVEIAEETEVTRYTYLGVKPYIAKDRALRSANVLVVEIGGGSTKFLLIKRGEVAFAHTYRLGSVRIREMLDDLHAPVSQIPHLLVDHMRASLDRIQQSLPRLDRLNMIAVGGDIRFAARQFHPEWDSEELIRIEVADLKALTETVLGMSDDELVRHYHISYPEADTLGPALAGYANLADVVGLHRIYVTGTSMRNGLIADFASESWSEEFICQVVRSARDLAGRYDADIKHAEHVTELACLIYRMLAPLHQLMPRHECFLRLAGLLHDIGTYIGTSSHHKHSMYVIQNSELFGLGSRDKLMVSLVARYHRHALPKPTHPGYSTLSREARVTVSKLAAILRVADALDRHHLQQIHLSDVRIEKGHVVLVTKGIPEIMMDQLALQHKSDLFEQVFGKKVILQTGDAS